MSLSACPTCSPSVFICPSVSPCLSVRPYESVRLPYMFPVCVYMSFCQPVSIRPSIGVCPPALHVPRLCLYVLLLAHVYPSVHMSLSACPPALNFFRKLWTVSDSRKDRGRLFQITGAWERIAEWYLKNSLCKLNLERVRWLWYAKLNWKREERQR